MQPPADQIAIADGNVTGSPFPAEPNTRIARRARRDRAKRRRWMVVAAVVVVAAVAVTVGMTSNGASPKQPALPPPAPASTPATIFSQDQLVSDPVVMVDGGRDYLYATGGGNFVTPHVPVRVMNGTTTLGQPTDVMPTLPTW